MGLGTQLDSGHLNLGQVSPRKEILQELAAPVASCRCRCSLIAGSHTTSKFMLIRGGQKLGETIIYLRNWNSSHLWTAPWDVWMMCAPKLNWGIWSGEGFHVQSVTNKCGPKKALSSSTLAHQKENLSFKMIKTNKTPISDVLPKLSVPRCELRQVPSCSLGLMRDCLRKPPDTWGWG